MEIVVVVGRRRLDNSERGGSFSFDGRGAGASGYVYKWTLEHGAKLGQIHILLIRHIRRHRRHAAIAAIAAGTSNSSGIGTS